MLGHALPKVHEEVLDLVEVGAHHAVQDSLAVGAVHQEKSLYLHTQEEVRDK